MLCIGLYSTMLCRVASIAWYLCYSVNIPFTKLLLTIKKNQNWPILDIQRSINRKKRPSLCKPSTHKLEVYSTVLVAGHFMVEDNSVNTWRWLNRKGRNGKGRFAGLAVGKAYKAILWLPPDLLPPKKQQQTNKPSFDSSRFSAKGTLVSAFTVPAVG